MVKQLTAPQLREILKNGRQYQRAVRLLMEQWTIRENQLKYDLIQPLDVSWARLLQEHQLADGKYDLNNYREASSLLNRHPEWFSVAGEKCFVGPFFLT